MSPDINTLSRSPPRERPQPLRTASHSGLSGANSRRTSQVMGPPTVPASATGQGNMERGTMPHRVSSSHEQDGPLRHPRPLTAAELYAECEKEQEAVVNRLTRELTALRAQSASVASNASQSSNSTSASLLPVDISDPNPTHQMMGATHPTPSRRHRSSSSVSNRSIPTPSTSVSATGSTFSTQAQAGNAVPSHPGTHGGVSQASFDRAAAATGGTGSTTISRQPSISAHSGTSTPARQSFDNYRNPSAGGGISGGGTIYTLPHRPSLSRDPSNAAASTTALAGTPHHAPQTLPSPGQSPSASIHSAMQHYTDSSAYKSEMELVKAENESLRQRVRALERALRARRRDSSTSTADIRAPEASARAVREREVGATSPNATAAAGIAAWAVGDGGVGGVAGPRERSESQSTTASSRRGLGGGVPVSEDEVRFGESAGGIAR